MQASPSPIASQPPNRKRHLCVLLHAYRTTPASLDGVAQAVAAALPGAHVVAPQLPLGTLSLADPVQVACDVLERIDAEWRARAADADGGYEDVYLVGHSVGALIARKAYVYACGETAEAPFEEGARRRGVGRTARPWAGRVRRIILLAGMNRGWRLSHHMKIRKLILLTLAVFVGHVVRIARRRPPLIFAFRRGGSFITQLRLQWLAMAARLGAGHALTVQLLGSTDDIVSPEDDVDLVSGREFVYLDVPKSDHESIVRLDAPEATARRAAITSALIGDPERLRTLSVQPADDVAWQPNEAVTDVIFVIHGIRDYGHWTHKIARRVKRLGEAVPGTRVRYATETSTYGYFAMLPFLLHAGRTRKVEWLMDQYTEAKARYPGAQFSFVGHSNGTYLLAKALEVNPACRFRHVVFAGSVVRRDYDWRRLLASGQVGRVLNFVATADLVVAVFPKAFQTLGFRDLGSAGHDGFRPAHEPDVSNFTYVRGGHGAAVNHEEHWDAIAHFIVHGTVTGAAPPPALVSRRRAIRAVLSGWIAPAVWLLIAAVLVAIPWAIIMKTQWPEWGKTTAIFLFVLLIWKIITRV